MRFHDVQSIEIDVPAARAWEFVSQPSTLVQWTQAFASVDGPRARLRTPRGQVEIDLQVVTDAAAGTIDWFMTFPDGSVAGAYSRIVPLGGRRCAFVFTLTPPPVPLEALEGALEEQSRTLTHELASLKRVLEAA